MTARPTGSRSGVQIVVGLPEGLQTGDVVAGKYRIDRVLGSGAMGVVVAAHHLNLDRTVAIKFLLGEALHHPDSIARFVREARAAARICSTHVVRVHDVAVLPNGTPYIELEYLEGCDLAARLRQCGRLPLALAVDFILQTCDAIAEAHDLGIIHRDIKPANLFAVPSHGGVERIKVLDFGISKAAASVWSTVSPVDWQPGGVSTERGPIGSPCYMSPEQMQSARDVDLRTDIWSLGVTLCELATGQIPFEGQSLVELYATIKSRQPLRLRSHCPNLPDELEAALLKCLQFDRRLRFDSVNAMATALLPFGSNRSASYVQRVAVLSEPQGGAAPSAAAPRSASEPMPSCAEPMTKTRRSPASSPLGVGAPSSGSLRRAVLAALLLALAVAGIAAKRVRREVPQRSPYARVVDDRAVAFEALPLPHSIANPADSSLGPGPSVDSPGREAALVVSPGVVADAPTATRAVMAPQRQRATRHADSLSAVAGVTATPLSRPPRVAIESSAAAPSSSPLRGAPETGALTAIVATPALSPNASAGPPASTLTAPTVDEILRNRE